MFRRLRGWAVAGVVLWPWDTALAQRVIYPPPTATGQAVVPTFPLPATMPTAPINLVPHPGNFTPPPNAPPTGRETADRALQRYRESGEAVHLRAIGEAGLPAAEAVPLLLSLLDEAERNGKIAVLEALQRHYPNDSCAAVPKIIELTRSPEDLVAAAAARALGAFRPVRQESIAALAEILSSPDGTREFTENHPREVRRIQEGREVIETQTMTLVRQLPDPRRFAKQAAAKGLEAMGRDARAAESVLRANFATLDAELGYHAFLAWCAVDERAGHTWESPAEKLAYARHRVQHHLAGAAEIAGFLAKLYPALTPGLRIVVLEMLMHARLVPVEATQIVLQESASHNPLTRRIAMQAASTIIPAHSADNIRVIAQNIGSSVDDVAQGAASLAINYGEPVPEFEAAALRKLYEASVGESPPYLSGAWPATLEILIVHPTKRPETARFVESLISLDAPLYRNRQSNDHGVEVVRIHAVLGAAANGPSGSPEAVASVEALMKPTSGHIYDHAALGAAARYLGALPSGPAKERLAAQLFRTLDDDYHSGMFTVRMFGQMPYMADPLFPERYTDARIEALRAFATMDAEFLRPREPQLRRRAQDPPTTYGAVKSNELAAQILQKLEARR